MGRPVVFQRLPQTSCVLCSEIWSIAAVVLPGCSLSCKGPGKSRNHNKQQPQHSFNLVIYLHNFENRKEEKLCNVAI